MLFLPAIVFSLLNTWNSCFHCSNNTFRVDLVAIMEVMRFCMFGYIGVTITSHFTP